MLNRYSIWFVGLACSIALWAEPVRVPSVPPAVTGQGTVVSGMQIWSPTAEPRTIHGTVTVAEGSSLTIEAGTRLQFDGDLQAGIHVLGKLTVLGTADRPVVMQAASGKAQWRGIWTDTSASVVRMSHAVIMNALAGIEDRGGNVRLTAIDISGSVRGVLAAGRTATVSVEDSKFSTNTFGVDAFDGATLGVTGSRFIGNRTAVSQSRTGTFLASNTFENNQIAVAADDSGLVKGSANRLIAEGKSSEVEIARLVSRPAAATVASAINTDTV